MPIYQTTSYVFNNADHAASLFGLQEFGNIYTRLMNPTNDVLEKRVAALEGGAAALATASGQAAETLAILTLANSGDEIVSTTSLYGGTYNLFHYTLPKLGIKVRFVDADDFEGLRKAINDRTRAVYTESLGNPKLDVVDLEKLASIAHETWHSSHRRQHCAHSHPLQSHPVGRRHRRPLRHQIPRRPWQQHCRRHRRCWKFDWVKSGRFPDFVEPDPSYHGLSYTGAFANLAFILKARLQGLRDTGACLSPFNAFLILQGIETLHLRLQRHSENALAVAKFLEKNPAVEWVNYPGLASSKYYTRAKKYLPNGSSAIVTFGIRGGYDAGKEFIDSLQIFSLLANIGDSKSLVIHPASTTHQQLTVEEQASTGVTPNLIRLSVGIEDIADLTADLEQAFSKVQASKQVPVTA